MSYYFERLAQRTGITHKGTGEKERSATNLSGTSRKERENLANLLVIDLEKTAEPINAPEIDNVEDNMELVNKKNEGIRQIESGSPQKDHEGRKKADKSVTQENSFYQAETEDISNGEPRARKKIFALTSFESEHNPSMERRIQADRANLNNQENESSHRKNTDRKARQIRGSFIEKESVEGQHPRFRAEQAKVEGSLPPEKKVFNKTDTFPRRQSPQQSKISEQKLGTEENLESTFDYEGKDSPPQASKAKNLRHEFLHGSTIVEKSEIKMSPADRGNINVRIGKISLEVSETVPKPRIISKRRPISKKSVAKTEHTNLSRYYFRGL